MSTTINNFEILNDGQQLAIDVETVTGSIITSIKLWNIDTFKDETLSIDLNYKLEQINNPIIDISTYLKFILSTKSSVKIGTIKINPYIITR